MRKREDKMSTIEKRQRKDITLDELKKEIDNRVSVFKAWYYANGRGGDALNNDVKTILQEYLTMMNVDLLLDPSEKDNVVWKYDGYEIWVEPFSNNEVEIHVKKGDKVVYWIWSSCYSRLGLDMSVVCKDEFNKASRKINDVSTWWFAVSEYFAEKNDNDNE